MCTRLRSSILTCLIDQGVALSDPAAHQPEAAVCIAVIRQNVAQDSAGEGQDEPSAARALASVLCAAGGLDSDRGSLLGQS